MNSTALGVLLGRTYLEQKDNEKISIVWSFFSLIVPAFYFYLIFVSHTQQSPIWAIIGVPIGLLSLAAIITALYFYFKNEKMPAYAREERMKMLQTLKILGIASLVAVIFTPVAFMLYERGLVELSISLGIIAGTFAFCAAIILSVKLIFQAFTFLQLNFARDRNTEQQEETQQDILSVETVEECSAIGWLIAIGIVNLYLCYLMYQVLALGMWGNTAYAFIIVGFLICFFLSLTVCITRVPLPNGEEVAKYKKTHKKLALGMLLFCLVLCVSIVISFANKKEYQWEMKLLPEEESEEMLPAE